MTLYIDSRERGLPLATYLSSVLKEKAIFKTLDAGDFLIPVNNDEQGKNIIIERSTITDFLGKKKTDRLSFQIDKMEELTDEIHFLIEEPYKLKFTRWNTHAAVSLLTAVGLKYHMFISQNIQWSASYVLYLHKKYGEDRDLTTTEYRVRHKTRKDMTAEESASWVLQGIEGIGDITAKRILSKYTLTRLALMNFDELKEITGSATLADRIFRVFNVKIEDGS